MTNTAYTQLSHNSVPRRLQQPQQVTTLRSVWQDNPAPPRARTAIPQPASPQNHTRSQLRYIKSPRTHQRPTPKRKTVQLVLWVKPVVKAELQRIADQEGLSVSSTGSAFLEKALQQNLHTQQTMLLDTVIEKAIGKHIRSYSTRLAVLLVRVAFDAGQTRSIATNILHALPDVTTERVQDILKKSNDTAKRNITHKTPQLQTVIEEVEEWLREEVNTND